jgi:thiol-disulfide isomerase/thioredoxin
MKYHLIITASLFVASCCLLVPSCDADHVDPVVEVQQEPEAEPVKNAVIELQLADWCGPCRKFKASGAVRELEAQGWTIVYTDNISRSYPSFRVWVNGKSSVFSGYSSKARFFSTLKKHIKDLNK